YLAYRHARAVELNDHACFDAVLRQLPEGTGVEGVKRYRLAYGHQTSGRMSAIGGMLQSCTREMKDAAYGPIRDVIGIHNYDLKGAQPNLLIELFEEANAHPKAPEPPLDASWMRRYVADPEAKASYAARVGVSIDTWKAGLCAVMMGGWLAQDPVASKGDVAALYRADPACSTPEGLASCWARLREVIGAFFGELQRWHEWLGT